MQYECLVGEHTTQARILFGVSNIFKRRTMRYALVRLENGTRSLSRKSFSFSM